MTLHRDNFYITLPSNSSMKYFPENTTTHFITRLSHPLTLVGDWSVALIEINMPMTFLHIPDEFRKKTINLLMFKQEFVGTDKHTLDTIEAAIPHGVYRHIDELVKSINNFTPLNQHIQCGLNSGGYASLKRICDQTCGDKEHVLYIPPHIQNILGFTTSGDTLKVGADNTLIGSKPAALTNNIPKSMFIYTDICESYITGDVQTPLLRVVPIETEHYIYGSTKIKCFSPPRYIPLLKTNFQSIEIDIRDEFGNAIPFEYGTSTVTLHFKRIYSQLQ